MEGLPDLWDEDACVQWVQDTIQRDVEILLFGAPLAEIADDTVRLVYPLVVEIIPTD